MKKIFYLIIATVFMLSCSTKEAKVTIENTSNFDRLTELVEIPIDSIKDKKSVTDSLVYHIQTEDGVIIPSQVTYDRKIIFQIPAERAIHCSVGENNLRKPYVC